MIQNRKYECPVCNVECISLKDRLELEYRTKITCGNCYAKLIYTTKFSYRDVLEFILYFLFILLITSVQEFQKVYLVIIAFALLSLYRAFFDELEEYKEIKPEYDINEFLDGLRNPGTGKNS